ncbi:hypothetical protein AB1K62_13370 [Parasphingorhabdus sp. JC815]|uniref:hypothetical protein n=1 Tax=Parasphingorhabdus sp. JC815 TaxID=3232140 RepID=UPI00345A66C8
MLKNGIIWITGLAIALFSGLVAMGAIAKNKVPELAVSIQPVNGFASQTLASNFLKAAVAASEGQFPETIDPAMKDVARHAFLSEPITPEAIAVLALGSAEDNKRELMQEAFALSRRERLITGWMIADSGAREDIPAILGYYDTMLRTSSSAASAVIPMMAGALADENFVEPFASLLKKNPPWARRFWGAVVATPEAVGNAARLRELLYTANEEKENYRDAPLISALVRIKQFEEAVNLFQLLEGQEKTDSLLHNGSFESAPQYPPLDWQIFSTGEYGAAITKGKLQLSAIANSGGLFARQLVKLPAEVVTISVKSQSGIPDGANIFLNISCAEALNNAPQRIRIRLSGKSTNQQISNEQSGCSFYWLDIIGRASESGSGFDVGLESLSLRIT